MILAFLLLLAPAWADPWSDDDVALCAEVQQDIDNPRRLNEDITRWMRRDGRPYTASTLRCLCAVDAHLSVQQAARERYWHHRWRENLNPHEVHTDDPVWSMERHVSAYVLFQLQQTLRSVPSMRLLPTRLPERLNGSNILNALARSHGQAELLGQDDWLDDRS